MQIVIDIPEDTYKRTKFYKEFRDLNDCVLVLKAINHAIELPGGHGRLIDADELSKDDDVTEWLSLNAIRTGKMLKRFSELFIKKINDAPTIIEADKEAMA